MDGHSPPSWQKRDIFPPNTRAKEKRVLLLCYWCLRTTIFCCTELWGRLLRKTITFGSNGWMWFQIAVQQFFADFFPHELLLLHLDDGSTGRKTTISRIVIPTIIMTWSIFPQWVKWYNSIYIIIIIMVIFDHHNFVLYDMVNYYVAISVRTG